MNIDNVKNEEIISNFTHIVKTDLFTNIFLGSVEFVLKRCGLFIYAHFIRVFQTMMYDIDINSFAKYKILR